MEESKPKGQDPFQNESLDNSEKGVDNPTQDRLQGGDQDQEKEQEQLKAAMLDWKRKGNTQLASACADALVASQENQESPELDDEYTKSLKVKVERIEAEAEAKKIESEDLLENVETQQIKESQEEVKGMDNEVLNEEVKGIDNEMLNSNEEPYFERKLTKDSEADQFKGSQDDQFNNLQRSKIKNDSKPLKGPINLSEIKGEKLLASPKKYTSSKLATKLTNTKFVLQIASFILLIEIVRIIILIS